MSPQPPQGERIVRLEGTVEAHGRRLDNHSKRLDELDDADRQGKSQTRIAVIGLLSSVLVAGLGLLTALLIAGGHS